LQLSAWTGGQVNTATRPNTRGDKVARERSADIAAFLLEREAALLAEARACGTATTQCFPPIPSRGAEYLAGDGVEVRLAPRARGCGDATLPLSPLLDDVALVAPVELPGLDGGW
jgi:hypothetical protein